MKRAIVGRRLQSDRRGAAAVEFAIIIVPTLLLIFGTVQSLLIFYARISLDYTLQNLAYDAANAEIGSLPSVFKREALCARSTFYLVDCNTSANFCFAVAPIDPSGVILPLSDSCAPSTGPISPTLCCYRIMVEYVVPYAFDPLAQMQSIIGINSAPHMIRAIALVYRA